jgi:hypothetical protein
VCLFHRPFLAAVSRPTFAHSCAGVACTVRPAPGSGSHLHSRSFFSQAQPLGRARVHRRKNSAMTARFVIGMAAILFFGILGIVRCMKCTAACCRTRSRNKAALQRKNPESLLQLT